MRWAEGTETYDGEVAGCAAVADERDRFPKKEKDLDESPKKC